MSNARYYAGLLIGVGSLAFIAVVILEDTDSPMIFMWGLGFLIGFLWSVGYEKIHGLPPWQRRRTQRTRPQARRDPLDLPYEMRLGSLSRTEWSRLRHCLQRWYFEKHILDAGSRSFSMDGRKKLDETLAHAGLPAPHDPTTCHICGHRKSTDKEER